MMQPSISPSEWQRLSAGLSLQTPAVAADIEGAQSALGVVLPLEYKEFLAKSDGAEGGVGENSYLILWRAQELKQLNDDYQVSRYAPGFVLFGSNGGGEAFAFDLQSPTMSIVSIPFVGMARDLAVPVASDFWGFLNKLWND